MTEQRGSTLFASFSRDLVLEKLATRLRIQLLFESSGLVTLSPMAETVEHLGWLNSGPKVSIERAILDSLAHVLRFD
jgi:hypothetical protein